MVNRRIAGAYLQRLINRRKELRKSTFVIFSTAYKSTGIQQNFLEYKHTEICAVNKLVHKYL